jgi:hypothetical protein
MNMRWAWTLPVLSALSATSITGSLWAQGFAPPMGAMPAPMQAAGYAPSMAPQMYGPPAGYAPAMNPQAGMPPAGYMAQQQGAVAGMPDVYGSYGYMPVDFATQPHMPPGYGGANYAAAVYGQPGPGPGGYGPPGSAMMDQHGYGGYGAPMDGQMGPGAMGPGGMGPGGMGPGAMGMGGMGGDSCPYCGGQGCQQCGGGGGMAGTDGTWMPNGLLGDVLGLVAPYPDGGCAAPRWYDFAVDYMMLKRDNTGRSDLVLSTFGVNGTPALTMNQLDFGSYKPGFRFAAALQIAAANSLEFIYFGQFNYTASARVRAGGNNLYSVFSNFGVGPFGGFSEFDQANFQQINYQSSFDSFEINWRCRWMAPNCRYQGSWTVGVRHFILDEKFRFASQSGVNGFLGPIGLVPARGRDDTDTTNDLTGIQFGTDAWMCLLPGLRAGAELQAGVYGNHAGVNTIIGSNLVPPSQAFREHLAANDVSFIGQANLLATYRINYQWSLRGGYQFLYVDGVALAPENFNPLPPNVNNPFNPRKLIVNTHGSVFYHGWNVGLEYMW